VGGFIQPDSIVPDPFEPAAWNRFGYVYGNPVRYTDPSGHVLCDKEKGAVCPFPELKIDITSWPDWLYNLTGGACYLIGCAVENNTLRTLTVEERAAIPGLGK
jgi:hypothetical protein